MAVRSESFSGRKNYPLKGDHVVSHSSASVQHIFPKTPVESVGVTDDMMQGFASLMHSLSEITGETVTSVVNKMSEWMLSRAADPPPPPSEKNAPIRKSYLNIKLTSEKSIDRAERARQIVCENRLDQWDIDATAIFGPMRTYADDELETFALNVERMAWHARSTSGGSLHSPGKWILKMLRGHEMFPAPEKFVSRSEAVAKKERDRVEREERICRERERALREKELAVRREAFDKTFVDWRAAQTPSALDQFLDEIPIKMRGFSRVTEDVLLRRAYASETRLINPYDMDVDDPRLDHTDSLLTAMSTLTPKPNTEDTPTLTGRALEWLARLTGSGGSVGVT